MTKKVDYLKIEIQCSNRKKISEIITQAKWSEEHTNRVDTGWFSFESIKPISKYIEPQDRITIKAHYDDDSIEIGFIGFVNKVETDYQRDPETKQFAKENTTIFASSIASLLTRNFIEGNYKFTKGFGEIIRKFGKQYGFDTNKVQLLNKSGVIYFKKMPIMEGFSRMAYLQGWCFYFHQNKIVFKSCKPEKPKVTIKGEDTLSMKSIKGVSKIGMSY